MQNLYNRTWTARLPETPMTSFVEGAARVLDIGATFDSIDFGASSNDADAIRSDWSAVLGDLSDATTRAR